MRERTPQEEAENLAKILLEARKLNQVSCDKARKAGDYVKPMIIASREAGVEARLIQLHPLLGPLLKKKK